MLKREISQTGTLLGQRLHDFLAQIPAPEDYQVQPVARERSHQPLHHGRRLEPQRRPKTLPLRSGGHVSRALVKPTQSPLPSTSSRGASPRWDAADDDDLETVRPRLVSLAPLQTETRTMSHCFELDDLSRRAPYARSRARPRAPPPASLCISQYGSDRTGQEPLVAQTRLLGFERLDDQAELQDCQRAHELAA